jgi:hypothetical protein
MALNPVFDALVDMRLSDTLDDIAAMGLAPFAVAPFAEGAGLLAGAGISVRLLAYQNAGGVGVSLYRYGKRFFGLDWHRFKLDGRWVNRPHYHRYPGMGKHRPWQGGW